MNIIDYLAISHKTFEEKPFGEVDSLILCQLFYAKIEKVLEDEKVPLISPKWEIRDFYREEYFHEMFNDDISDKENRELYTVAAGSRRFRNVKVKNIISHLSVEEGKQFAACTFEIEKGVDYVCFRGTDGTMLGWKEDFMMSYLEEVPAQREAVEYIEKFYGNLSMGMFKKLYIGGHSKGGNLAMYAGTMVNPTIQQRIIEVYSHDGPGFREQVLDKMMEKPGYESLNVNKTVPQASIVGMLMEGRDDYKIVDSKSFSIGQHVTFEWQVKADGTFEYANQLTSASIYFESSLKEWLKVASTEQLEIFVDTVFGILMNNGINTVHELKGINTIQLAGMYDDVKKLDPEIKEVVNSVVKTLAQYFIHGKMVKPAEGVRKLKEAKAFLLGHQSTRKNEQEPSESLFGEYLSEKSDSEL